MAQETLPADTQPAGPAPSQVHKSEKVGFAGQVRTSFGDATFGMQAAKTLFTGAGIGAVLKGVKELFTPVASTAQDNDAQQKQLWTKRISGAGLIIGGGAVAYLALTRGGKGGQER